MSQPNKLFGIFAKRKVISSSSEIKSSSDCVRESVDDDNNISISAKRVCHDGYNDAAKMGFDNADAIHPTPLSTTTVNVSQSVSTSKLVIDIATSSEPTTKSVTVTVGRPNVVDKSNSTLPTNSTANILPPGWNVSQKQDFLDKYPWLIVTNEFLSCSTCQAINNLGVEKTTGMDSRPSLEWCKGTVTSSGLTKKAQQTILRNKILKHKTSKAHLAAAKILETSRKNILPNNAMTQHKHIEHTTERIFRTAYKQAKKNLPFYGFETEIDLQELNGLDMGRILHSNVACTNMIAHISSEMRAKFVKALLTQKQKVGIIVDEASAHNKSSALIIYLRTQLDGMETPINAYLDLIELNEFSATGIANAILNALSSHKITHDFLSQCLISFTCDGASVMLGKNAGVAKVLEEKYPNIITWHCCAHRLELAVSDVIKDIGALNHFKIFIDKLYSLYNVSNKNRIELSACAAELNTELLKIGRVLDTRWVASSSRAVDAVWKNFPALALHFADASNDESRDSKHRAMFKGLRLKLTSTYFVETLGIMKDALRELAELSLELQTRSINIVGAHRAICRQIAVLEAMVERPGKFLIEAQQASTKKSFKGVLLTDGKKKDQVHVDSGQFFRSLSNSLRSRMVTVRSSAGERNIDVGHNTYNALIKQLKVLYPFYWPDEIDTMFGEDEIEELSERFGLHIRDTIRSFRRFKETAGKDVSETLRRLFACINSVPISSAEAERGFSQMNLICTTARASLNTSTIASLMYVKLMGPPLKMFNPEAYVKSWLIKGRHSADDKNSKARKDKLNDANMKVAWSHM